MNVRQNYGPCLFCNKPIINPRKYDVHPIMRGEDWVWCKSHPYCSGFFSLLSMRELAAPIKRGETSPKIKQAIVDCAKSRRDELARFHDYYKLNPCEGGE